MSGEISGPGGHALAGMLLLEHQRQLVKEGKANRDTAHELGIAAKKVGQIYDAIADSAREFQKTMEKVDLAMTAISAGKSVAGMPAQMEQAAAVPNTQEGLQNWENEWATAHEKMTTMDKVKMHAWDAVGHFSTVGQEQMQRDDAADKKIAASMKLIEEGSNKLSETAQTTVEKDREVAQAAYKVGGVFIREG